MDASFEVFEHLETLCAAPNGDFADSVDLSEALFASAWSRGINRRAMAGIAVRLYLSQHDFVKASLDNDRDTEVTCVRSVASTLVKADFPRPLQAHLHAKSTRSFPTCHWLQRREPRQAWLHNRERSARPRWQVRSLCARIAP